jgi:hypothetical protein
MILDWERSIAIDYVSSSLLIDKAIPPKWRTPERALKAAENGMWGLDAAAKQNLVARIRASESLSKLRSGSDDDVRAFHVFATHLPERPRLQLLRKRLGPTAISIEDLRTKLTEIETVSRFLRDVGFDAQAEGLETAAREIREARKAHRPKSDLPASLVYKLDTGLARVYPHPLQDRRELITRVIYEVFRVSVTALAKKIQEGARSPEGVHKRVRRNRQKA